MIFLNLKRLISRDAAQRDLVVWNTLVQHWRRVVLSTIPMLVVGLWTARKNGVLEMIGSVLFVVAGTLLLCWGFERQGARHARNWRTFAFLESISILWITFNWLIEWLAQ